VTAHNHKVVRWRVNWLHWKQGLYGEREAWNNVLTFDMIFNGSVINEFTPLQVPTHLLIGTRDTTGPGR